MLTIFRRCLLLASLALAPVSVLAHERAFEHYQTPDNAEDGQFVAHEQFKAAPFAVGDVSRFMFDDWTGPAIPVWTYVPASVDVKTAPILFMMHGAKRNPARYLLEWVPHAQQHGFVVVAPEFSRRDFRGSQRYNRGNVSFRKDGKYIRLAESEWSFAVVEPLFDHTVKALASEQTSYTLYGHSAGSQFAHRFLLHKPEARVNLVLAANAGWYTMPDLEIAYPYGLQDSGVSSQALEHAFKTPVVILLGDQDIDVNSGSLNRTDGAMRQGTHRYSRGLHFLATASEQAARLGVRLDWHIERVEGVGHSNSGMAKAAASYVR
ncbi:MAG: hypothetical protein AAGI28_05675 [Pseudomonadota bacterium]